MKFKQENTKTCPECGHVIPADSKFCPDCGAKIVATHKDSYSTFFVGGVSFKMILVEHGEFMMGATNEQKKPQRREKPVHKVILTRDYYIGETPVAQSLLCAVMNENPSRLGEVGYGSYVDDWNELPVENVSWNDCQRFIRKLNSMTEKNSGCQQKQNGNLQLVVAITHVVISIQVVTILTAWHGITIITATLIYYNCIWKTWQK